MSPGDTVLFSGEKVTLQKLPRSEGRKRPRAEVKRTNGDTMWVFVDELKEVPNADAT